VLRKGDTLETRWVEPVETYGDGGFTFGYFGGLMDAATGLLYIGNGQYYTCTALCLVQCRCDPVTGRFLTRDVNPDSPNPYVPWNPIGAVIGPLGLIALVYGRKKKGGKVGIWLVLLLLGASVGMTLASCGPGNPAPAPSPTLPPSSTPIPAGPGDDPGSTATPYGTPTETLTPTCTPTPMLTSGYYIPVNLHPNCTRDIHQRCTSDIRQQCTT